LRPRKTRTRRRSSGLALAVLLFAGCGGGEEAAPPPPPAIERAVARELAATSDAIAAALEQGDVCTAAGLADDLNDQVVEAINARRIPPAFQEDLQARANELVNEVNCPPPPAEEEKEDEGENGKGKGKGKGKEKQDESITLPILPTVTEDE
jgi:hypothetical protein